MPEGKGEQPGQSWLSRHAKWFGKLGVFLQEKSDKKQPVFDEPSVHTELLGLIQNISTQIQNLNLPDLPEEVIEDLQLPNLDLFENYEVLLTQIFYTESEVDFEIAEQFFESYGYVQILKNFRLIFDIDFRTSLDSVLKGDFNEQLAVLFSTRKHVAGSGEYISEFNRWYYCVYTYQDDMLILKNILDDSAKYLNMSRESFRLLGTALQKLAYIMAKDILIEQHIPEDMTMLEELIFRKRVERSTRKEM